MKTIRAIEDGFQSMSMPVYVAFCAGACGLMFIIGCVIDAVVPFAIPGMR